MEHHHKEEITTEIPTIILLLTPMTLAIVRKIQKIMAQIPQILNVFPKVMI